MKRKISRHVQNQPVGALVDQSNTVRAKGDGWVLSDIQNAIAEHGLLNLGNVLGRFAFPGDFERCGIEFECDIRFRDVGLVEYDASSQRRSGHFVVVGRKAEQTSFTHLDEYARGRLIDLVRTALGIESGRRQHDDHERTDSCPNVSDHRLRPGATWTQWQ